MATKSRLNNSKRTRTTANKPQDDTSKLHSFCEVGNLSGVRQYIDKLSDEEVPAKLSTKKGVFGYTPLHLAVAGGHIEVLNYLLSKVSKSELVNCQANSGYTPLHLAASSGHRNCIKALLTHGANISAADEYKKTPKQSAELSSKASIVRLLRSEEIIKEVETNGENLTELLQQDLSQLEKDCITRSLQAATRNNNPVSIGKLLVKGALQNIEECIEISIVENKPCSRGMLLLAKAARDGNKSMVQKLYGENVTNPHTLNTKYFNDDNFPAVQKVVIEGKVTTVVPIDIARKYGKDQVREELLIKTDVNKETGNVFWHGLRLLKLEIPWLRRISWVKRLRLARNGFKSLPQEMGSYLKQVVKLDLQHNELGSIPRCILELPSLGELNLAHNLLEEIPDVVEWSPCLAVLILSHNHISKLPDNVIAPAIRELNLSFNQFRQVPLCICSFMTLRHLNLSENQEILQLPPEMGRLKQLTRLQLDGLKDLNEPPKNMLKDARHCVRYLDSKLRCAKGFYKMKLMLVGQANRGKTTLVARLQGKDCGNESTVGVDVSEWSYKPSLGKHKFFFSIWDFGGQEEYYATHQCFLSERSLYLILFNLKHGKKGVYELKPWLNNIALRAPNSLVIIVGTHLDQVSDEERANVDSTLQCAGQIVGSYSNKLNIAEIMPVGLTGRIENIGLLKEAIYNHAANYTIRDQVIMGRKIPASYHALDKQIEVIQGEIRQGEKDPIMTSEQFKAMVLEQNLPDLHDDDELQTATIFLTNVGSLLHYDDRSHNLNELYFVDPRWLCDMMSKVITIRERNPFVKNGILHSKDIPSLFRDKQFPLEHFEQYLTLLDRFEIALPLDNRRMLIPSMLLSTSPHEEASTKPLYTRYIVFTKAATPPGFWSRLLSRIMHSVQKIIVALDKTHTAATQEEAAPDHEEYTEVPEKSKLSVEVTDTPKSSDDEPSMDVDKENMPEPTTPTAEIATSSIPLSLPVNEVILPFCFSHFPAKLPINLQNSYAKGDITLKYWREGLLYSDPEVLFRIESFLSLKNNGDGVVLRASCTNEGKQIIGQLVDIVLSLIQEWYPGISDSSHGGSGVGQKVLCIECMKMERSKPFKFQVETCLKAIANSETSIKCGYEEVPDQNHTVPLTDVVPDLLLQDIDLKFLLKEEDLIYTEDRASLLGKGGFGKVYSGKCSGKPVAIKMYLSNKEDVFSELRLEAKLLQQSYHPCFVCLAGVCIYPMMALVLELAPLGSLKYPLLTKKMAVHRLTIFRIALEVAAALRFVHKQGIIFRDLKADNVLLWTLNPDSLCHCKITDFGIATHLSPVGVKGLKGTKGFIAPEVLHIDKRKQRSGYNHKADTFSYAMLLYQMIARTNPYGDIAVQRIDSCIETGERPKLSNVNVAHCAFLYLTKLMMNCWEHNPKNRPEDDMLLKNLSQPAMQCTMAVTPVKSTLSLRRAIAITQNELAEADVISINSELWVCCDGPVGAEVNMYNTHTMAKVKTCAVNDNQVHAVIKCCNHVWIGFRVGIECSVINIFSIHGKELVHNIRMRDISVSCMACTNESVYIGTVEGYCFQFPSHIDKVRSIGKPELKYISKSTIDGIACTQQCVWASHGNNIYFITFEGLKLIGSVERDSDAFIGQLSPSPDGKIVWSAQLNGGQLLTAWDTDQQRHAFDVDTSKHLATISEDILEKDRIITAMVPAKDCVWVGMATGHILVCNGKDLLTWFHPYTEYVRFLTVLPCSGPCEMEECMVASGGKGFQSMIEDLNQAVVVKDDEKGQELEEDYDGKGSCLVLWEAFHSKAYRQMSLIEKNSPAMFENHNSISTIIQEGQFVDGTNILQRDASESDDSDTIVYEPDLNAKPYQDTNYETETVSTESDTTFSDLTRSTVLTCTRSRDVSNPTPSSNFSSDYLASEEEVRPEIETSDYLDPFVSGSTFRPRTTTIVSKSRRVSTDAVFEIKLHSTKQTVRITCPSPPQLTVLLRKLLADASANENDSKLVYYTDTDKEVEIKSQEHFKKYLMFENKPQLWLATFSRATRN